MVLEAEVEVVPYGLGLRLRRSALPERGRVRPADAREPTGTAALASSRHMGMVEPFVGCWAGSGGSCRIVMAAGREVEERHARIAAARRQHLPICWPRLLSCPDHRSAAVPPVEPVLLIEPHSGGVTSPGRQGRRGTNRRSYGR